MSIGDSDELGSFVFRTTGFNSIRTLPTRLQYFAAVSGGYLACMPLELKLRGKYTTQSHRSAIYYAELVVRSGISLNEAIRQARTMATERLAVGFDQSALDAAARLRLPLKSGVLSFVQNVDKELRNGGKASTCGIHAGI